MFDRSIGHVTGTAMPRFEQPGVSSKLQDSGLLHVGAWLPCFGWLSRCAAVRCRPGPGLHRWVHTFASA